MISRTKAQGKNFRFRFLLVGITLLTVTNLLAAAESSPAPTIPGPTMTGSIIRVFGALALVFGVLFGGVWLMRNWQRISMRHGGAVPNLNVLEVRSLGPRQNLFVVGYQKQRMLVAASPAGIQFLTPLPEAEDGEPPQTSPRIHFADALQQVLSRGTK